MTVYIGDVLEGIETLQGIVLEMGEIESASQSQIAHAVASARTLTEAARGASARVAAAIPSDDALGLAGGLSGVFAPSMAAELIAQRDLVEQGVTLFELGAYSGRILVNLGVRG